MEPLMLSYIIIFVIVIFLLKIYICKAGQSWAAIDTQHAGLQCAIHVFIYHQTFTDKVVYATQVALSRKAQKMLTDQLTNQG